MKNKRRSPSTRKVRRLVRGGKRGAGHEFQAAGRRIRRPDPCSIAVTTGEKTLTAVAGLVEFGAFVRAIGLREQLRVTFAHMKSGPRVVYPMHEQLQLLMDVHVAGEGRVFGLESLAHDPLFVELAGGTVPSVDTLYDDLGRFGEPEIIALEALMAEQGLTQLRNLRPKCIHIDIDTTVTVLFGTQEGALPGPNPRYHGRPSYHPMIARVSELDAIVGAQLRYGDTGFGNDDVPRVVSWVDRVREAVGPDCLIHVRIDGAGDCTALLAQLERRGVHYFTKADMTADLMGAIAMHEKWRTIDVDADGRPTRQVATVNFRRGVWANEKLPVRVVVVRSTERENGKQIALWADLDWTVQCFLTNDWTAPEEDVAGTYDERAGIEPVIGELKSAWSIGKAKGAQFDANHAAFLIKLLAYNVFRRFVAEKYEAVSQWRTPWARRTLVLRPGRITRSGRRTTLHTMPLVIPMLN